MSRFETEVLTRKHNLEGLARMNAQWVDRAMAPFALDQAQVLDGAAQVVVVICPASTDPLISYCMV